MFPISREQTIRQHHQPSQSRKSKLPQQGEPRFPEGRHLSHLNLKEVGVNPLGARGVQKAELNGNVDSENDHGGSSSIMYYIGLDVHKKTISYCVKDASGQVHREGTIGATRNELDCWVRTLPQPRIMAMEATIFTGWIYDHLLPHAEQVKVAHPLMLRAIAAAKKKNDRIDAGKIADCLRCDFLPECHMASTEIRDRRRTLRYRHLLVRQMVQMKNRISGLLMETGVSHNKQRLHKVGYFGELLSNHEEVQENIRPLLRLSRETIVRCQRTEYALVSSLQRDPCWPRGSSASEPFLESDPSPRLPGRWRSGT